MAIKVLFLCRLSASQNLERGWVVSVSALSRRGFTDDAGQLSSSWLELHYLYPGALLGKRAERTCHNFRISCSPHTRSISLLPVS